MDEKSVKFKVRLRREGEPGDSLPAAVIEFHTDKGIPAVLALDALTDAVCDWLEENGECFGDPGMVKRFNAGDLAFVSPEAHVDILVKTPEWFHDFSIKVEEACDNPGWWHYDQPFMGD